MRTTDDGGIPLLLLPEISVTTTDLARGLGAAALAQKRYGVRAQRNTSLVLREGRRVPTRVTSGDDAKVRGRSSELQGRAPQTLPGIGTAKVMAILFRDTPGSRLR